MLNCEFIKPGKFMRISGFKIPETINGEQIDFFWYLKKWVTYYHFIHEVQTEFNKEDKEKITKIFDGFIESISDEEQKTAAQRFFYNPDIRCNDLALKGIKDFIGASNDTSNSYLAYLAALIGRGVDQKQRRAVLEGNVKYSDLDKDFPSAIRSDWKMFKTFLVLRVDDKLSEYGSMILRGSLEVVQTVFEYLKIRLYTDLNELPNLKFSPKKKTEEWKKNLKDHYSKLLDDYNKDEDFYPSATFFYEAIMETIHSLNKHQIGKHEYNFVISRVSPFRIDVVKEELSKLDTYNLDAIQETLTKYFGDEGPDQKDFDKFIYGVEQILEKRSGIRVINKELTSLIAPLILGIYEHIHDKYGDILELLTLYRKKQYITTFIREVNSGVELKIIDREDTKKYYKYLEATNNSIKVREKKVEELDSMDSIENKYVFLKSKLNELENDVFIKVYSYIKLLDLYQIVNRVDNKRLYVQLSEYLELEPKYKPITGYLQSAKEVQTNDRDTYTLLKMIRVYMYIYYVYSNPFEEIDEIEFFKVKPDEYIASLMNISISELESKVFEEITNIIREI